VNGSKTTLSQRELEELLTHIQGWSLEGGALVRSVTFSDFPQAMAFVNKVAELAERENHHPDIDIRYNRVKLGLISHDAGGITGRDSKMARLLDELAAGD